MNTPNSAATVEESVFSPVVPKPDHPAVEHSILDFWNKESIFEKLRARNADGPKWSFIDGPITANNSMGVHHAWGRTLKDIYQRWHALRGFDQRYQNGFDCQGLWVEVEVERALGLNSKPEIEAYGLDKFSRACRDRVAKYAEVQTDQSIRLGQWMDWDNDYYTLSDTNISYIWQFLAECRKRDWLYVGNRPMVWCPRCGTSLSQHELIDSYKDLTHPSLFVGFPLTDRDNETLAVWTTTPWTLPANVAAAVNPEATYALVPHEGHRYWVATDRAETVFGEGFTTEGECKGIDLVGAKYTGVFADLEAAANADYKVVGWSEVSMDDGTGIVHIAPGCGAEDYELGKVEGLTSIMPVDESGMFYDQFDFLGGMTTHDAARPVIDSLRERGLLIRAEQITHRFPTCWRCSTELIFRLVDEWFISCDEIREQMIEANRTVEWVPAFYGKRMEDWLNNMGDWCISRKRYWGLPLPFYRDPEGDPNDIFVVSSHEELLNLAVDGSADELVELHRPWIDDVKIKHPETGRILERVTEVGDCWLDAGIVPFSTMGWKNPEHIEGGYATGASVGLSTADLPSHEEWQQWFPCEGVIEMREQIRLWFYSLLFMSVVLEGKAPYKRVGAYEKVHDESGRPMHKSWGNAIWFDDAVEKMGADIMRWQFAGQNPANNLNFGYGPADDIKRKFLTLWNVYSFFVQYANADSYQPSAELVSGDSLVALNPEKLSNKLDRWIAARTHQMVLDADAAFTRWDSATYTRIVEQYIDELSNWYVRRSRRRFWKAELGVDDRTEGYNTLWAALVTTVRVLAPVMPFLAEELWGNLVTRVDATQESVHLSPWPTADEGAAGHELIAQVDAVQRIIGLGRAARSSAKMKLRQPLSEVMVFKRSTRGAGTGEIEALIAGHTDDICSELSVRTCSAIDEPGDRWTEGLMPLLPRLGPKYGPQVADIRKAVGAGDVHLQEDGTARVGTFVLESDEFEHRSTATEGYAVAEDHDWVVVVSTVLDDELIAEGYAREIVRKLQQLRKDSGLDITDRISVTWSAEGALATAFTAHSAMISDEVLATSFNEGTVTGGTEVTVDGLTGWVEIQKA